MVTYLVSHSKILAILRAAADSAIQALVHVAVLLVGLVSTIVSPIAEITLRNAASI